MIRAFIDSSVLFAACLSESGASREILRQGIRGNVVVIISDDVIDETERNLSSKRPAALPIFHEILDALTPAVVNPTKRQVVKAAQYTAYKDAPIVAAAMRAKVEYLVSLDRRHLVGVAQVEEESGLAIVLPEELLRRIREQ